MQPTWSVHVRGEVFYVQARDVDEARTLGMIRAMRERGWKLRDVYGQTPLDGIELV